MSIFNIQCTKLVIEKIVATVSIIIIYIIIIFYRKIEYNDNKKRKSFHFFISFSFFIHDCIKVPSKTKNNFIFFKRSLLA